MFSKFLRKKTAQEVLTIAFYNLENLFDTKNDPHTFDDDFTPNGKKKWSYKRYRNKIRKLAQVISQIGIEKSAYGPAIVGIVEVENHHVLNDLTRHKSLINEYYGIVHHDSPDERGIDVALLYKKELFELLNSETFALYLEGTNGERDYTRDVLLVTGNLKGERIHILVNHWPSRRAGLEETEEKRINAAKLNSSIVKSIVMDEPDAKIVVMGDFNDDPHSNSIKNHLVTPQFFNPMERLLANGKGSLKHKTNWHLFDQIIFSKNFLDQKHGQHSFKYAEIFDRSFIKSYQGKHKGNPFRTYFGRWYNGGFSDHFPVYVYLEKQEKIKT